MLTHMARPKTYDEALRSALLVGAADTIAEAGVDGLALRSLAAAHGTSTNAVYAMFGGKPGLVAAVLAQATASFTAAQRAVPATDDALADLRELGRAYRSWALAHPALYAVMFGGRVAPQHGCEDPHAGPAAEPGDARAPLDELVTRGIESGVLRVAPVAQVATSIWAMVHGLVSLELGLWPDQPREVRDAAYDGHLAAVAKAWAAAD
jgi:AcrR family transcriptional regulator